MRIISQFDRIIARKLRSSASSSFRRQHRSAVRQMFNIYRLDEQGRQLTCCDDAIFRYY